MCYRRRTQCLLDAVRSLLASCQGTWIQTIDYLHAARGRRGVAERFRLATGWKGWRRIMERAESSKGG